MSIVHNTFMFVVNCENPGVLDNGRIFIIGNYGNFLNRPYVKIFEDERRVCNINTFTL